MQSNPLVLGLNAAILCLEDNTPKVLVVDGVEPSLPFGPFDQMRDRSLDMALRRWVRTQTALELEYVEQLYTFGNRFRDPGEVEGGPRIISIGYMALVQPQKPTGAHWQSIYDFLPWEDWRQGRPAIMAIIDAALKTWALEVSGKDRTRREERIAITFGAAFEPERALERVELLYEAGLLPEAHRDFTAALKRGSPDLPITRFNPQQHLETAKKLGQPMAVDHRRILATALTRLRGKLKYRPLVFDLVPAGFTLLQLQKTVEALNGESTHKQNFRRIVLETGLVEPTGENITPPRGRPAELYRFRPDVLKERSSAGLRRR